MGLLDSREFPTTKSVQSLKPKEGRNSKAVVHKFRPSDGGVASITTMVAAGETPDLVATCGADRKLRIYEKGNGKMSHGIFKVETDPGVHGRWQRLHFRTKANRRRGLR